MILKLDEYDSYRSLTIDKVLCLVSDESGVRYVDIVGAGI